MTIKKIKRLRENEVAKQKQTLRKEVFCVFAKIKFLNTNKEYVCAEIFCCVFLFPVWMFIPTQKDRTGFMSERLLDEIT